MKRVIRLLSTFLLATSLFAMISCSNDSVDNSAPAPQPETKPEEGLIKDGEYTIKLKKGLKNSTFTEMDILNNKPGNGILTFNHKLIGDSEATITGMNLLDGNYIYYDYELPKELNNKVNQLDANGFILAKKPIPNSEIKVVVSNNGKKIDFDWNVISVNGTAAKYITYEGLSLFDGKKTYFFMPKPNQTDDEKLKDYIGEWEYLENATPTYKMNIKNDKTGSLVINKDKTINFTIDTNTLGPLKLVNGTNNVGTIIINKPKDKPITLEFFPDKSLGFNKIIYSFVKAIK